MMGDNLFGVCSNLTPTEGQLLSEEKSKKFKEKVKSVLKNGDDRYIIAFNWIPIGRMTRDKVAEFIRESVINSLPPFKKSAVDELITEGYKLIHIIDWNAQCANATAIEQGLNPVYVTTEITV
ncbi:MAG: hypothetical protein IJH65_04485 [Methanobrevibacter sp.]|nr:hypothetical protein [Methanobrevibacter sp.]